MLNELAQGLRPIGQGVEWFEALPVQDQFEVLRDPGGHCIQARATVEDGPESVRIAGIRPTHTPAVLITRGQLAGQLTKNINLPQDERLKAFRLLVALLGWRTSAVGSGSVHTDAPMLAPAGGRGRCGSGHRVIIRGCVDPDSAAVPVHGPSTPAVRLSCPPHGSPPPTHPGQPQTQAACGHAGHRRHTADGRQRGDRRSGSPARPCPACTR